MPQRILIDTNVLLDFVTCRKPYDEPAASILQACVDGKITGCVAAHSIPNMFYILRKDFTTDERRKILKNLCRILEVESIDREKILSALDNIMFQDFEDCLQNECSKSFKAEYIVTRNPDDFKNGDIPCIDPGDYSATLK